MKDVWDWFIDQRLVGVVYREGDGNPPSQLFLVFSDAEGRESHVEIYAMGSGVLCTNPRGGGVEHLGDPGKRRHVETWPKRAK